MSFDIGAVIGSVAPTLAAMLLGPLGGTAVTAIVGALGLPTGSTMADVTTVAQTGGMTPDGIAALREADQKHAEILSQQGIDLAKINAVHIEAMANTDMLDRTSARDREIAVKDNTPKILTYVYTFGLFLVIAAEFAIGVMHIAIDPVAMATLDTFFGVLTTMVISSKGYYFGNTVAAPVTATSFAKNK